MEWILHDRITLRISTLGSACLLDPPCYCYMKNQEIKIEDKILVEIKGE